MSTMPRDPSQRYAISSSTDGQQCDRRTTRSKTTASNFVDSLLHASSAPLVKKMRLNGPNRSDDHPISESANENGTSVQSYLAASPLALMFGGVANETLENGDRQSSGESESPPNPTSGRSSAADGFDEAAAGVAPFLINEEDERSPPPGPNGNSETNGNYFDCHHCNKYFWTETSLKHHSSLYHSEKSFVCEICGKAFRFRSNLAEHRSVHTSLKPYVCKFCGKSSRLKGNLTKHILKHHKKEQNAYIGKDDIIIKKGKKSVKDPAAVDFLEKSMIVLTSSASPVSVGSASASSQPSKHVNVTSSNATSAIQFPVSAADLGSAALQLLSMASKTEAKPPSRSSKRGSNQPTISSTPSSINGQASTKTKPEKQAPPRETGIFGNAIAKPFVVYPMSNGKLSISQAKEPNRLPMPAPMSEEFADGLNLAPVSENGMKLDYDDILSSANRNHLRGDVDAIFESLLGKNLCHQSDVTFAPTLDGFSTFSTFSPSPLNLQSKTTAAANGGAGTRCQLCGKHFRKSTNLAVHVSIKHGQAPSFAAPAISIESPSPPAPLAPSRFEAAAKLPSTSSQNAMQPKATATCTATPNSTITKIDLSSKFNQPANSNLINGARRPIDSVVQSPPTSTQFDALNGLMNKSGVSKDLKEIRVVLQELKRGLPDVAKLDELLSALDARVDRLERQLETSVNTLYVLVQMQTDMNSAFSQFKNDVVQRLKSLKSQHPDECGLDEDEDHDHDELDGNDVASGSSGM